MVLKEIQTNGAPRDDNVGASDSIDIQDNAEEENETNSYQPLTTLR